jgi:signal transduction histidine kinase
LNNLVGNAVKFTPDGGYIEIALQRHDREAWFSVRDTGVGIPADRLDRVFKRFYQVESPLRRHYGGLGLGLAIAKELVELHNGRIWAESRPGEGSTFTVALPLLIET